MIHDLTVNQVLRKTSRDFNVKGDGTPHSNKGEDDKDEQYYRLGRMMLHHRNNKGGFDKLLIAGLPAYRAVQNMQCLTGSGLTVPVGNYIGFEMNFGKYTRLADFYSKINAGLPQFRKLEIEMKYGDILEGLPTLNQRFNVFDFDFMNSPAGAAHYSERIPKDRPVIKKSSISIFLKTEVIESIITTLKKSRAAGPTAVYCNWASGRQMSMEDWEILRQGLLKRFQNNFVVETYRWTHYHGNSNMVGIQLILGKTLKATKQGPKRVKEPIQVQLDKPERIGDLIRTLRWCYNFSQRELAEHLGVSRWVVGMWEIDRVTPSPKNLVKIFRLRDKGLNNTKE